MVNWIKWSEIKVLSKTPMIFLLIYSLLWYSYYDHMGIVIFFDKPGKIFYLIWLELHKLPHNILIKIEYEKKNIVVLK